MSQIINEDILWKAAEKLRDKVDPADYKNIVLGLVFLKYVSDKYTAKYNELIKYNDGREEDEDYYTAEHVFIVPKESLWTYVASHSKQDNLGQVIDNAFILLEKINNQLKGILPKTYSKSDLDKTALGELVDFFTNNLNMEDADGDFFGQVYEYYVGAFAKYIPTKGGEFFTPKSVVQLMVDILEPYKGRVYDPCCGSGGMFVQCSKFVKEHQGKIDNISIFGQESNPGTWKMAKMNLAIRGLEGNLGERNGDTFTDDLHKSLRADYIIANPPYNLKEFWKPSLQGDPRWVFGKPSEKNGNYAWLSLMYAKLSPKGKAAILMPNGATTSNTQDDYKIRKAMIESGKIDAILALPNKLFANVSISVQCWILNKDKTNKDILFVNADEMGKLISRKIRVLEDDDINKILKAYKDFKSNTLIDLPGFCKKATLDEIIAQDYSLNPGRYVGADESNKLSPEEIKEQLKVASAELLKLMKEGMELEEKVKEILEEEIK
ncbi:type I restriction-modification system subunit M [Mycoplasmopsis bovirhinis]|uniref:site-specific DNA-methyltransferase (adenine-specific) n=1 Tax=Mycoplasmopsis bovirhinis TaxID=29553 RepID=A0A449AE05_9BACT|nr:class I SAM-dependent DNA methyltransferase [Mycoplasmopsis bovirhinis]VEU63220.1 Probable type I restriction enzyme BthVORF4518P M protein [Mycoplasmopsis bovirhinis]VEU64255.1 Probable type I restriction enzyme BthVORF4518P M protein [Mycoplasmopsis bovirhinis]